MSDDKKNKKHKKNRQSATSEKRGKSAQRPVDDERDKRPAKSGGVKFYDPPVVASIVTALLLNATDEGSAFGSFEDQFVAAIEMAGESNGEAASDYRTAVGAVLAYYRLDETTKDLFLNAHMGIKLLLTALATDRRISWSDCRYVNHGTIKGIFNLRGG